MDEDGWLSVKFQVQCDSLTQVARQGVKEEDTWYLLASKCTMHIFNIHLQTHKYTHTHRHIHSHKYTHTYTHRACSEGVESNENSRPLQQGEECISLT